MDIPKDGELYHTVRYQPLNDKETITVSVKVGNEWRKVDTEEFGIYKLFDTSGNRVEILVTGKKTIEKRYIIIGAAVVAVILLIIILVIRGLIKKRIRKRKRKRAEARKKTGTESPKTTKALEMKEDENGKAEVKADAVKENAAKASEVKVDAVQPDPAVEEKYNDQG